MIFLWLMYFWWASSVIVLIIDWLEGFPRCAGDKASIKAYMQKRRQAGDSNPRLSTVRVAASVLMFMGPLGIKLPPIKYL